MQYNATIENNEIKIKPNIEKKDNGDVTVHMPSFPIIAKAIKDFKENQKKEEKIK